MTKDQAIAPPYGSKREAAKAVYTPPFKYEHGYIFDSQHLMVADNGPICDGPSVEGAVASRVRGWGRLGYLPNGAELQDEIGQMMADALNALYQPPAPDCRTCHSYDGEGLGGCLFPIVNGWKKHCTNGDQYQPAPKVVLWRTE
jgi:hypothetical protein